MAGQRLRADVRKDLMVSPREGSRTNRRRIAGERSRPPGAGEATAAPPEPDVHPGSKEREGRTRRGAAAAAQATRRHDDERFEESGPAAAPAPARSVRPGPPNWVLGVLAGLLAVALALDGFVVWRELSQRQAEEDAARALHSALIQSPPVAEKAAAAVLAFRHDTVDKDLAEARRFLSEEYAPDYISSIGLIKGETQRQQVTVKADVLSSGVVEAGAERAEVLLFVNQTTTTPLRSEPTTALNRVVFSMMREDGAWKVDDISAF
jgi:Mce-associated membrane protein